MATLATQYPGLTGVAVTASTASGGGDKVAPGTRVHVVNGAGAPITVTIATPANMKVFDVPSDLYADPADGLVALTYSSPTSVTLWVEGPVAS